MRVSPDAKGLSTGIVLPHFFALHFTCRTVTYTSWIIGWPTPDAALRGSVAVLHTILGIEGLVADGTLICCSMRADLCHNWS